MSYFPLTNEQAEWRERVAALAQKEIAPRAEPADESRSYPAASIDALRREGLLGLRLSKEHGGLGADLLTTCLIVEEVAKKCPSTAMCYKMHLEAAEVISRTARPEQVERFLKPMARGGAGDGRRLGKLDRRQQLDFGTPHIPGPQGRGRLRD